MNNGPVTYLGWRDCLLAIRTRIDELTQGADPAPWYVASPAALPGDNETPNIRQMAINARANATFFRAMLIGSLKGWFVDGDERWPISGWAWADQGGDWRALMDGNDFLHPLAAPELRRWALHTVLVERDAFETWLGGHELNEQSGFPALPPAHDEVSRPPLVTYQPPPLRPNVSIAHAVSWLAFGISLDADTLTSALSNDFLGENRSDARRRLKEATDRLLTAGTGGLPFLGKFVEAGSDYGAPLTEPIPPERLEDFRQFDVCFDGLRYGRGVHQDWSDPGMTTFERAFPATTRRYVDVKVERASLMALEVAPHAKLGPNVNPGSDLPPDDAIVTKMLELKAAGLSRDEAAKRIRTVPGFELVGNEHARRLVSGTLPKGRPKLVRRKAADKPAG